MRNLLDVQKNTSQDRHNIEVFVIVVETNVEVLYDKLGKFVPYQNLLKIKDFFDYVCLQQNEAVSQMQIYDLKLNIF